MRAAYVIIGVVVVALIGAAAYAAMNPDVLDQFKGKKAVTDEKQIQKLAVGFVANPYQDDYGNIRVGGYIDNLSSSKLGAVDLEINLLDDKGNRKESIKYALQSIDAKSRKTFDTVGGSYNGPRTAQMKIVRVEVIQ